MKKSMFFLFAALALFMFSSCEKSNFKDSFDIVDEAINQESIVSLTSSNYERVETTTLERSGERGAFVTGVVEYRENGILKTKLDFGNGDNDKVTLTDADGDKLVELKEDKADDCNKKEDKCDYIKIIGEPLVKTDDCDYIVAGTIEFYKKGEWVATIDYGDGTCDSEAVKYTADSEEPYYFSLEK